MSDDTVEVAPVRSPADEQGFLALPYRLYHGDPNWVAPLRQTEKRRWSPRHNASLRSRLTTRFLARRGRRVVGRVAAVVDTAFVATWGDAGFFGFFEAENDPGVATALLSAAENFVRGQGLGRVIGPVNLTTHDEVGFLCAGFDSPPTILSPYNPPYYPQLAAAAGYAAGREYHAYLAWPTHQPSAAVRRLVRRAARRENGGQGLRLRPLDPARFDEDVRKLFTLYNDSFAGVWGFVPITWEEFRQRADGFRAFYRPDLVVIAEVDGRTIGFGLVLPDINAALLPLRGRLFPLGWLRLMRAVPRLDVARFILLGVHPAFMGRGIAPLISYRMARAAKQAGIRATELSLVQEANASVRHVIDAFGARRIKTYRLYEKGL